MKLYEIDNAINTLLLALEPDENGLLPDNCDELAKQLEKLDMQKQEKLTGIAKYIINTKAELEFVKAEKKRLETRVKVLENKEDRLMKFLDNVCGGNTTDLGIVTLCHRNNEHVEFTDEKAAIKFLQDNKYADCIRTKEPEISKDDVKKLIQKGIKVTGAEIVKTKSCYLH